MKLAGCASLNSLVQDGFLIDSTGGQLLIDILETQTGNGIAKALAGNALITEQQDCLLHNIHDFVLRGKNLGQRHSVGELLAPTAANIDLEAVLIFLKCAEGTLVCTTSTVVTCVGVDANLAIHNFCNLDGTRLHDLALLTAMALGEVDHRNLLADDTQVIQARLSTVVGAATDTDLELMGQRNAVIAHIELLVDLIG